MATTTVSGFAGLKSNLEITGLQAATVSTRQRNVRDSVADGFEVLSSFVAGSYARSTMIAPLKESDIDVFVVLANEYYYDNTPAALLDRLRTVLRRTYPTTPRISRNGQAVTITFTDFAVDVVPAFHRQGGGYLIPDSISGRWISTNPQFHATYLSNANGNHAGDLVPLIKMIKGWNRCIKNAFVGFYLELMTTQILDNVRISDYWSGLRFVFDHGRESIRYTISDPSGYGGQIGGLSSVSNVNDAVRRFQTAYNRAVNAEQFANRGDIVAAYGEWRKILPRYFPAYG